MTGRCSNQLNYSPLICNFLIIPNTFEIVKLFFEKVQGQTILDFGLAPHINPVACTIEESSSNFLNFKRYTNTERSRTRTYIISQLTEKIRLETPTTKLLFGRYMGETPIDEAVSGSTSRNGRVVKAIALLP